MDNSFESDPFAVGLCGVLCWATLHRVQELDLMIFAFVQRGGERGNESAHQSIINFLFHLGAFAG